MFEQLVRPFAARPVTTTRRIPAVISEPSTEPAIIAWGAAGDLPEGIVQPAGVNLENIMSVGFNVKCASQTYSQSARKGEDVEIPIKTDSGATIGKTTIDRTKEITFSRREPDVQPFSYAAVGVTNVIEGLRSDIPGSNTCAATYKFSYPAGSSGGGTGGGSGLEGGGGLGP